MRVGGDFLFLECHETLFLGTSGSAQHSSFVKNAYDGIQWLDCFLDRSTKRSIKRFATTTTSQTMKDVRRVYD